MSKLANILTALATVLAALLTTFSTAQAQDRVRPAYTADYVAQMLDYVSRDYAIAVQDGAIIDEDEYLEQLNIIAAALKIGDQIKALAERKDLRAGMERLADLVKAKAPVEAVRAHAQDIRNQVLVAGGVRVAPQRWPSLARGKQVFDQHCVSCHGTAGDGRGPAAAGLTPKPTDFLDRERMAAVSPLSAFHSVKLGIANTAMQGFPGLSDDELWAVSFYLISLKHRAPGQAPGKLDPTAADLWLKATASLPDEELMQALPGSAEERRRLLTKLRLHSGD